ncbi:MAG: DUF3486 family protein [Deltaproteobacteria bacterium]|nr:DUF3486 family protein [Deltaproteobacteria bacterium]
MRGRRSKATELPPKLLSSVRRRLRNSEFDSYEALAEWFRQQGQNVSLASLKDFGVNQSQRAKLTRSKTTPVRHPTWRGTAAGLMRLTQEKLGSALAEVGQLKKGDMSRLAHAVAHLTQAGISLERWNDQISQRKHTRSKGKSKVRGGLSPATSQALRNALLGIPPSDTEQLSRQTTTTLGPVGRTSRAAGADEIEGSSRTSPVVGLKEHSKFRDEGDG